MLDRSLVAVTDVLATTPGVMFCVKSADGVYVSANVAFAERAGVRSVAEVVGRTAADLFPAELAARYEAQDRQILSTGRMLTNALERITRVDGSIGWFLTSKSRWTDDGGRPVGLVAVSVDLRMPADAAAPHPQLAAAVEFARGRVSENITLRDLADAAEMTGPQFERACRRILGLSPKQLLMRLRVELALHLLETTDSTLAAVAAACGYFDQSALNRHFRRVVGYTPGAWRIRDSLLSINAVRHG
jgi:PAS domain S-box-containing protein